MNLPLLNNQLAQLYAQKDVIDVEIIRLTNEFKIYVERSRNIGDCTGFCCATLCCCFGKYFYERCCLCYNLDSTEIKINDLKCHLAVTEKTIKRIEASIQAVRLQPQYMS